ncbi:hypothetical protein MASR2M15_11240 [Anaerolineales bacterium]
MQKSFLACLFILILASACGGDAGIPDAEDPGLVSWNKDPYNVVFRADVQGGNLDEFIAQNDVPLCTIYGDGRIVWEVDSAEGRSQVLFSYLNDTEMTNFVMSMVVDQKIYTQTAGANLEVPSKEQPVYELLEINVNDQAHKADSFSGWTSEYFEGILDYCRNYASAPQIFEPTGGWLETRQIAYDPRLPTVFWDNEAAGLNLGDFASTDEKRWIEGDNVRILWNQLRTISQDVQFDNSFENFNIALQIPGVTLNAPPAPAAGSTPNAEVENDG